MRLTATNVGAALALGIEQPRERLHDPTAAVVVVTPSQTSKVLARQQLLTRQNFILVSFEVPNDIVRELGQLPLLLEDRQRVGTSAKILRNSPGESKSARG